MTPSEKKALAEFKAELRALGDPSLRNKVRTIATISKTQMGAGYEFDMEDVVRDFQASLKEVIERTQRG